MKYKYHQRILIKEGRSSLDSSWTTENIQTDNEEQTIPGWMGFYHEVTYVSDEHIHDIHYLPAINSSPT